MSAAAVKSATAPPPQPRQSDQLSADCGAGRAPAASMPLRGGEQAEAATAEKSSPASDIACRPRDVAPAAPSHERHHATIA
jgi:hypothetical protein